MIFLASFFGQGPFPKYNIARWAPATFQGNSPSLSWLGARGVRGDPLRHLEPDEFRERYFEYLKGQQHKLRAFLFGPSFLDLQVDLSLCCWCTPQRQRRPTLYCHRILIGHLIEHYRPDLKVAYVDGAQNPVWTDKSEVFVDIVDR